MGVSVFSGISVNPLGQQFQDSGNVKWTPSVGQPDGLLKKLSNIRGSLQ
jgi:hypothetical protein